jgi:hypothetical protein
MGLEMRDKSIFVSVTLRSLHALVDQADGLAFHLDLRDELVMF